MQIRHVFGTAVGAKTGARGDGVKAKRAAFTALQKKRLVPL